MSEIQKQLVWLCGHSAVGKRRILDELIVNDSWRDLLRIPHDAVAAELDLGQIEDRLRGHAAVLVKWQNAQRHLVFEAMKLMPEVRHRVIHVHRPVDEHRDGFKKKFPKEPVERFDHDNVINKRNTELYRVDGIDFIDVVALERFSRLYVI